MFGIVVDTTTEKEQLPPPGLPPAMNAPEGIPNELAATTAVMVVDNGRVAAPPLLKHCTLVLKGLAITMFAGNASVRLVVVKTGTKLGLLMVTVTVLVPIASPELVGLKDLVIVGSSGWVTQLPVSP